MPVCTQIFQSGWASHHNFSCYSNLCAPFLTFNPTAYLLKLLFLATLQHLNSFTAQSLWEFCFFVFLFCLIGGHILAKIYLLWSFQILQAPHTLPEFWGFTAIILAEFSQAAGSVHCWRTEPFLSLPAWQVLSMWGSVRGLQSFLTGFMHGSFSPCFPPELVSSGSLEVLD